MSIDPPFAEPSAAERLAAERAELTRTTIRDAMMAILAEEHPASVSMPAVAKRAGVSVRTVYRYFPTKQALIDAVATWHMEQVSGNSDEAAMRVVEDTQTFLPMLWRQFADNIDSVRAQHQSDLGRQVRQSRADLFREQVRQQVDGLAPQATEDDLQRLIDLIMVLTSSSAFFEFHDRSGRDPEDAAAVAWWAVMAAVEQFVADQGIKTASSPNDPDRPTGTERLRKR